MIRFFKNLISGVLSFFVGLLGGKKSEGDKPSLNKAADKAAAAVTGLLDGKKSEENQPSLNKAADKAATAVSGLLGGKKSEEDQPSPKAANTAAANGKNRKRSGYFMELDETEEQKPAAANQSAKATQVKTPEPVAAKAESAKTPEPVAANQSAKAESAKTQGAVAADQSAKSAKVELVQTAEGVKVQPAEPASASPITGANGQKQTETTFAPKYLMPSTSGRRRPGANMTSFLDMARQVNTRRS